MIQTFKLKNGELSFEEDKIVITDSAKKQNRNWLISSGVWTVYGILSVLRYFKTGDPFLLWTGLFIGIAHFVILVRTLFRSAKSEILRSEIVSWEIKQRFGNRFLDIRLKENKTRRVNGIEAISAELKAYMGANFGG
jgi:hypothetical protein